MLGKLLRSAVRLLIPLHTGEECELAGLRCSRALVARLAAAWPDRALCGQRAAGFAVDATPAGAVVEIAAREWKVGWRDRVDLVELDDRFLEASALTLTGWVYLRGYPELEAQLQARYQPHSEERAAEQRFLMEGLASVRPDRLSKLAWEISR